MRRLAVLALVAVLAACQTPAPEPVAPPPPPPPPPVQCVEAGEIPAEPPTVGDQFNGDAKHDLEILAPSARALRQWGQTMRAMLEVCAGTAPPAESVEVVQPVPDAD